MMKQFLILAVLFLATSCANFKEPDVQRFDGVKLEKMDGKKIAFLVKVVVENENWYALKVKPSTVDVFIEDVFVGKLYLTKKVKIKAKSAGVVELPVRAELEDGALMTLLKYAMKDKVGVHLKGKIKGGVFCFYKRFPVDEKRTVDGSQLNIGNPFQ